MNDTSPNILRLFDLLMIPVRLAWNILLTLVAIALTIAWLCFVLPSVIGIILLAIFWPDGFIWPMTLCYGWVPLWPGRRLGDAGPLNLARSRRHDSDIMASPPSIASRERWLACHLCPWHWRKKGPWQRMQS